MSVSSISNSDTLSSYSNTSGSNSLGQQDFLTLLVAQLENQDPLDPQDNTEFISQMAQFSSLEQQIETNEKLDELTATNEQTAAYSLLGQQVIVATDSVYLQGNDIDLGFSLDQDAASASINILDGDGKSVASFTIDNPQDGYNFVNWNGTDSSGNSLETGAYSMDIEVTDSDGESVSFQSLVKVSVDEVALDSSSSVLTTAAGNISYGDISSVVAQ